MKEKIELLWRHCPAEVAVYGTIALACAVLLAVLIAVLMMPTEMDSFEEAREC